MTYLRPSTFSFSGVSTRAQKKCREPCGISRPVPGIFSRFLAFRPTSNHARSAPGRFPPREAVRKGEPIISTRLHSQSKLVSHLANVSLRRTTWKVKNFEGVVAQPLLPPSPESGLLCIVVLAVEMFARRAHCW